MSNLTKPMFIQVGARRYPVATFVQASQMFCEIVDAAFDALSIFVFCGLIYFGAALLMGVA